jgi:hypothetical protein
MASDLVEEGDTTAALNRCKKKKTNENAVRNLVTCFGYAVSKGH